MHILGKYHWMDHWVLFFWLVAGDSGWLSVVVGGKGWYMMVGGTLWCCVLDLKCVHRQITFVINDQICSLALKTNEPKMIKHVS